MMQINSGGTLAGIKPFQIQPPDTCPICRHPAEIAFAGIATHIDEPKPTAGGHAAKDLQAIFRCPRQVCRGLFIAYYQPSGIAVPDTDPQYWKLSKVEPQADTQRDFETTITEASPHFVVIYNQAAKAEASGLNQLCGPGYRKALEFLIKDYLKSVEPKNAEKARRIDITPLAACIANYVDDPRIKA